MSAASAPTPPLLTACIAVWGRYARYLPAALRAVREQLAPEMLEILVLDNATWPPLWRPEGVDLWIRLAERVTLGAARNASLPYVRTEYVCFVDVDDELRPGVFLRALDLLVSNSDASAAVTRMEGVEGRLFPSDRALAFAAEDRDAFTRFCTELHLFCVNNGTIFRTDAVRAVGGYGDLRVGSDVVLSATIGFAGRVLFDCFVGHVHLTRPDSLSGGNVSRPDLLAAKRAVRRRLGELDCVPRDVKDDLRALARRHRRRIDTNWRLRATGEPVRSASQ